MTGQPCRVLGGADYSDLKPEWANPLKLQKRLSVITESENEIILLGTNQNGSFADIRFERRENEDWQPTSYGTCEWTIDGYSSAAWMLREGPDTRDDSLRVTAANNCEFVEDSEDVIAVSDRTETAIQLLILERNIPKPDPDSNLQSLVCPLGSTVDMNIHLNGEIGNRQILGSSSKAKVFGQPTEGSGR